MQTTDLARAFFVATVRRPDYHPGMSPTNVEPDAGARDPAGAAQGRRGGRRDRRRGRRGALGAGPRRDLGTLVRLTGWTARPHGASRARRRSGARPGVVAEPELRDGQNPKSVARGGR